MDPRDNVVGMAGYFVSALMQTSGFHTLSQIIQQGGVLFAGLGYFIFLCCGLGALSAYAMFGDTKRAAYLLIGPVLFYAVLGTPVAYDYTAHQFGTRLVVESRTQVKDSMQNGLGLTNSTAGIGKDTAYIPLFVAKFDAMVSTIVQGMVALLVDTKNNADLQVAAQERILSRLLTSSGESVGFQTLLSQALMGECAEEMRIHSDLGSPRLRNPKAGSSEALEIAAKQAQLTKLKTLTHPLHPKVTEFIQQLGEPPMAQASCEQVWKVTKIAALRFAEEKLKTRDEALTKEFNLQPAQWDQVYFKVREKLIPPTASPTDMNLAFRMLAGIFLKNSLDNTTSAKLTGQLSSRTGKVDLREEKLYGNIAATYGVGSQNYITYFATMVPYIQGLILFLLSVSFPFFCIFLLMPGRIGSFFTWMGLWVWVKSWDIGFAVVAILRELLWQFIPRAGQVRSYQTFNEVNLDDPANLFNFIYQSDPTQSMATYYMLMATLTLAVPLITGQFCAGAIDVYETLAGGFRHRGLQVEQNESKAPKIRETTRMAGHMYEKRRGAAEEGARHSAEHPGRANGSDLSRNAQGDATFGRHQIAGAKMGLFNYFWSNENKEDVIYAQTMEGRRDVKANEQSGLFVDSMMNYVNEPYVTGRTAGAVISGSNHDSRDLSWRLQDLPTGSAVANDPLSGPQEQTQNPEK